jgi:hypothetical protein
MNEYIQLECPAITDTNQIVSSFCCLARTTSPKPKLLSRLLAFLVIIALVFHRKYSLPLLVQALRCHQAARALSAAGLATLWNPVLLTRDTIKRLSGRKRTAERKYTPMESHHQAVFSKNSHRRFRARQGLLSRSRARGPVSCCPCGPSVHSGRACMVALDWLHRSGYATIATIQFGDMMSETERRWHNILRS